MSAIEVNQLMPCQTVFASDWQFAVLGAHL